MALHQEFHQAEYTKRSRFQQWLDRYPERVPEIFGTIITAGMLVYFLASWALGFVDIIWLRILYLPIMVAGVYYALKQFRRTHKGLGYFRGLVIGVSSSFIAVSTFVLILFILFQLIPPLYNTVMENSTMATYMNTYLATFAIWVEGTFAGFMTTYVLMNYIETTKE